MIGLVICTLLICATVIICILGWKYLDERDDLSYQRWNCLLYTSDAADDLTAVVLWLAISFIFIPLGGLLLKLVKRILNIINYEENDSESEEEENEEN